MTYKRKVCFEKKINAKLQSAIITHKCCSKHKLRLRWQLINGPSVLLPHHLGQHLYLRRFKKRCDLTIRAIERSTNKICLKNLTSELLPSARSRRSILRTVNTRNTLQLIAPSRDSRDVLGSDLSQQDERSMSMRESARRIASSRRYAPRRCREAHDARVSVRVADDPIIVANRRDSPCEACTWSSGPADPRGATQTEAKRSEALHQPCRAQTIYGFSSRFRYQIPWFVTRIKPPSVRVRNAERRRTDMRLRLIEIIPALSGHPGTPRPRGSRMRACASLGDPSRTGHRTSKEIKEELEVRLPFQIEARKSAARSNRLLQNTRSRDSLKNIPPGQSEGAVGGRATSNRDD